MARLSTQGRDARTRRSALLIGTGAALLVLAFVLLAFGRGTPVKLLTGTVDNQPDNGNMGCYTSADTGMLVTDPVSGVALIEENADGTYGHRVAVTWPPGWIGRQSGSGVEVLTPRGDVYMRTGTKVHLMGGFTWVDGSFLTCGGETLP
jgi:hypothetical protein